MKIEKTIKYMMNTVYGYSIRRKEKLKKIFSKDIQKTLDYQGKYVVRYDDKVVTIKKCVSEHFYYPQYTKRLLKNYHAKMKTISELVDVLYCNIDAILVSESDYLKLKELGYINEDLGYFSVQHVFTKFAIKNSRTWIAITDKDEVISRPKKLNLTFEEFMKDL